MGGVEVRRAGDEEVSRGGGGMELFLARGKREKGVVKGGRGWVTCRSCCAGENAAAEQHVSLQEGRKEKDFSLGSNNPRLETSILIILKVIVFNFSLFPFLFSSSYSSELFKHS